MTKKINKRFKKASQIETPEKPQNENKLRSVLPLCVAGFLVASFLMSSLITYLLYQNQIVEVKIEQLSDLTQNRAELTAQNVERYLISIHQQLAFFARKPTLNVALAADKKDVLKSFEERIKKEISNSVAVRMFVAGRADLDSSAVPPVRFSELEMIRRALQREKVFPEALIAENDWLITLVVPVPEDEQQKPIGTISLILDINELHARLEQNNRGMGEIVLKQTFETSRAKSITKTGVGGAGEIRSASVKGSYWSVEFNPSADLKLQTHVDAMPFYIVSGVIFVVLCGAALFFGLRLGRHVDDSRLKAQSLASVAQRRDIKRKDGTSADPLYQAKDILDIDIAKEDQDILGLGDIEDSGGPVNEEHVNELPVEEATSTADVPAVVFRAYDIRGIAKEQITNDFARRIGQALGSEAIDNGEDTLIVARDARSHSPELTEWLIRGVLSTGCHVLNIGTVPTPLLYYATETLDESQSGVVVTASHNPAEYNGFKVVIKGKCRSEKDIQAIRTRIIEDNLHHGAGQEHRFDIIPNYIDTIFSDVALAGDISIVLDAGNGVTGIVAPRLFEELGCHVTPLYCDLDGRFPNHSPDPSVATNLDALIEKVKETNSDLGVAFDGDGDRLAVVTPKGKIIWPDRLLMLFAKDIVSRNPGADVVFDVKCTRHLNQCITSYGGRPIMWRTGHSPMKDKMSETGALVGGEFSGHIFIKDRWYGFDDGMYAAARLIEIVSLQGEDLDSIFDEFPETLTTPEIRIDYRDEDKFAIIEKLVETGDFGEAKITSLDGLRADYPKGWGLVRASNTSPSLTLRFEADDEEFLHELKALFVRELRKLDNTINVDWKQ